MWCDGRGLDTSWCDGRGLYTLWCDGRGLDTLWCDGRGLDTLWCDGRGMDTLWPKLAYLLPHPVFTDGLGTRHRYRMRSNPHGIALVIGNIKYREGTRLGTRLSAVVDEGRARAMFEALHYTVVLFRDLTAGEMTMAFQLVAGSTSFDSLPRVFGGDVAIRVLS